MIVVIIDGSTESRSRLELVEPGGRLRERGLRGRGVSRPAGRRRLDRIGPGRGCGGLRGRASASPGVGAVARSVRRTPASASPWLAGPWLCARRCPKYVQMALVATQALL